MANEPRRHLIPSLSASTSSTTPSSSSFSDQHQYQQSKLRLSSQPQFQEQQHRLQSKQGRQQQLDKEPENYLEIIDDLTKELASLSSQVTIAQEEFIKDDMMRAPFETSFRELEMQNDLLQRTIESLEAQIKSYEINRNTYEKELTEMNSKNTELQVQFEKTSQMYENASEKMRNLCILFRQIKEKCQCDASTIINVTDDAIVEEESRKPKELQHVFQMLDRKSDELQRVKNQVVIEKKQHEKALETLEEKIKNAHSETMALEEELRTTKKELGEARLRIENLSESKQNEEGLRMALKELSNKLNDMKLIHKEREALLLDDYDSLKKKFEDQSKGIDKKVNEISNLDKELEIHKKQIDSISKENVLCKGEIIALKNQLVTSESIEKNLREQLRISEAEHAKTKANLERYYVLNEEIVNIKESSHRLKEANYDLVRKYNELVDEYNKLEDEYRKALDIKDQLVCELEATRNWQKEQLSQDKLTSDKVQCLEDHIASLLQDREVLIHKVNQLHRDNSVLSAEVERYKTVFGDTLSETYTSRGNISCDLDPRVNTFDLMIRKIRRTARKLSQTRIIWEDGIRRYSD